ncbi:3-oxoacyl-ACP synthase III family protein [Mycobacterium sp. BMJ-28]
MVTYRDCRWITKGGVLVGIGIFGTGFSVPSRIVGNDEIAQWCQVNGQWVVERTGVRQRRYAKDDEPTSVLASQAGRHAMSMAAVSAGQVHTIVVATSTPDQQLPSTAARVQNNLNLNGTAAFDVNAVCCGFLYAFVAAAGVLSVGGEASETALVIGADTYSRIMNRGDRRTVSLFGDGAGAAVIGSVPAGFGMIGHCLTSDGSLADYVQVPAGGSAHPLDAASLQQGLDRFQMNGKLVKEFALVAVPKAAQQACDEADLQMGDVDRIIMHQGNVRLVEALTAELGVDPRRVAVTADRFGNTASASVPMTLAVEHARSPISRGETVMMLAVGGGMTTGAVILRWY